MERLTDKEINYISLYQRSCDDNHERGRAKWYEMAEKLRHIENLEEEIGLSVEEMALILKALKPKLFYIPNYNEDNEEYIHLWQQDGYADDEILEITEKNKDLLNAFKKCFKEY